MRILLLTMFLSGFFARIGFSQNQVVHPVAQLAPADPAYVYRATVLKVVDGDTIDVGIDLGFDVTIKHRLRLKDVYAAEKAETNGKSHTDNLSKTLPIASQVLIKTEKNATDKYGRYVADVWLNSKHINQVQRDLIGQPSGKGLPGSKK